MKIMVGTAAQREHNTNERVVEAALQYFGGTPRPEKATFHAQEHARDNWHSDTRQVKFHDARNWPVQPSLEREGFALTVSEALWKRRRDLDHAHGLHPRR